MGKMLTPVMYTCNTYLFNEDDIDNTEPLCSLAIPEWIVRGYYNYYPEFAKETAHELNIPVEQATFERWYNEVYTAEDMDGLYDYALKHGFQPVDEEERSVPVTVHSIYDKKTRENIDFGLDDVGYEKCTHEMCSSDKYADEDRYEYFGTDLKLNFVWRMTPQGFDKIRKQLQDKDIFAQVHVGTIMVEIKCAGGGYDPDAHFPIEQTFVWGIEDPRYGYEIHGTPYKYLDDVSIDIPIRRSRTGFETAFEQSFISFLNNNPEWVKEAIKETVVDNWY